MTVTKKDNTLLRKLAIRFGFVSELVGEDTTIRNEIMCMIDDGCPNITGNTQLHDLATIGHGKASP
jgi:hypothetical protein